jgi:hypothetical protein
MSNVHIKRAVENIKTGTTVYTPIVEVVVNAIQAIEEGKPESGRVKIVIKRSDQYAIDDEEDGSIPAVESITVEDNGIGFDEKSREAFDTLYTDYKISQGGKGFGRFTCLKYFKDVRVDSIFMDGAAFKRRQFEMGKKTQIIVGEKITEALQNATGTVIHLDHVKPNALNKRIPTIARSLVEKLLPYFINDEYACPQLILEEEDGSGKVVLNDYLGSSNAVIREIQLADSTFTLEGNGTSYVFQLRIFKFLSPRNTKSKISLVADNREVTETATSVYVPEFTDEFYEITGDSSLESTRNYVIKTYVFGDYLNTHVSLERGGFDFQKDQDLAYGISQAQIEEKAAELTKEVVLPEVILRQEKKVAQIESYVENEAPWHKAIVKKVDFKAFPYNPSKEQIEAKLQEEKFKDEVRIRRDVTKLLSEANEDSFEENVGSIVERISESSKNDLVHYVALRRNVLELFGKSLEFNESKKYESEGYVHNIIFPKNRDNQSTDYEDHNLWLIDERLNFTRYLSSDVPLNGFRTERPDIIAYDQRCAYRGDNESSNPVTIFEFKKPGRDDFVDPSSKEDPVEQILRYVINIQDGKFTTPKGREILVAENTRFYGYVVCDLTPKVKSWLAREKDFTSMPDGMGWFKWFANSNLYMEVIGWNKILKDANMRNKVFFHKLGI